MSTLTQTQTETGHMVWTGIRVLSGLMWLIFGLNGFFQFIPMPPPAPEAGAFMGAMAATGYIFPLIKLSEIVASLTLLSGKFINFGLLLLAPILVNIILFHLFLDPGGILMGLILGAMHIALVYHSWDELKVAFKA